MRTLLVITAAAAAGCAAVGPDYQPPAIATPASFDLEGQASISANDIATWWEGFGDEQLSALVEEVLASNLDLSAAIERVEVARASYGIVSSSRFPTLTGTASYNRAKPPIIGGVQNQWRVGGAVSWEIDLFGRVRRSVEVAIATLEARIEEVRGVQVALAAETVATYLQVLSLQERLDIAALNVERQRRSLIIADQRFEVGMAAGLDPAQARVNLHTTQASVPSLELQLRRSLHRLAVLTGKDPRALLGTVSTKVSLPNVPTELMVGLPADLLRNRPDIRSLERELAAQSAQIGVATAALYPSINLVGSWDWLARTPSGLLDDNFDFGSVGIPVSIPIFNAGRLRSQVSAEEAALRALSLDFQQKVLAAQEEVENALVAIVNDRRQAELLGQAVVSARESVDLSRELYASGQSGFQNVLDAQRSEFGLQDDLARSKLNTLLDMVDLYLAIGGGWGAEVPEEQTPATDEIQ